MNQNYSIQKVVMVGPSGVGKTEILHRLHGRDFAEYRPPTIGCDFMYKIYNKYKYQQKEYDVKLQLWDTAGQERFRSLSRMYYKGANIIVYVYDISKQKSEDLKNFQISFDHCEQAIKEYKMDLGEAYKEPIRIFMANKCDLVDKKFNHQEQLIYQFIRKQECINPQKRLESFIQLNIKAIKQIDKIYKLYRREIIYDIIRESFGFSEKNIDKLYLIYEQFICSAKTKQNIEEAFEFGLQEILKRDHLEIDKQLVKRQRQQQKEQERRQKEESKCIIF